MKPAKVDDFLERAARSRARTDEDGKRSRRPSGMSGVRTKTTAGRTRRAVTRWTHERMIDALVRAVAPAPEDVQQLYLSLVLAAWPLALRERFLEINMNHELQAKLDQFLRRRAHYEGLQDACIAIARHRDILTPTVERRIRGVEDADYLLRLVVGFEVAAPDDARALVEKFLAESSDD